MNNTTYIKYRVPSLSLMKEILREKKTPPHVIEEYIDDYYQYKKFEDNYINGFKVDNSDYEKIGSKLQKLLN